MILWHLLKINQVWIGLSCMCSTLAMFFFDLYIYIFIILLIPFSPISSARAVLYFNMEA